jgi:hypothetical protein
MRGGIGRVLGDEALPCPLGFLRRAVLEEELALAAERLRVVWVFGDRPIERRPGRGEATLCLGGPALERQPLGADRTRVDQLIGEDLGLGEAKRPRQIKVSPRPRLPGR